MAEFNYQIHSLLSQGLWPLLLAAGVWGVAASVALKEGLRDVHLIPVYLVQALLILQATLGLLLVIGERWPASGLAHLGFGLLAALFLGWGCSHLKRRCDAQARWVFVAGIVVLVGVTLITRLG